MNRHTGRSITGMEHLRQSVGDILSTPIGSRVMRRDYGSLIPELLDAPDNAATRIRMNAAVASALMQWEPRVRLNRIAIARDPDKPGKAEFTLVGSYGNARRAAPLTLQIPVQGRAAA
ncbi:GPW/gp25 family protein [Acidovorax sp. GBBC 3334]|uniref:GPW/gp25 family protein n=1 Tax=Acidovorax sp. GBBC 3334 TaxID=2940496 RepID=UPI00230390BD|nr:GPW/gp25 family protein [Acidovorax sp. GBBC 3334]MDA8455256.1 GPW/gp25 family protein [Acidovorax sp. GBBC 3334]